ncbi:hypothetical protein [Raoultella sp. R2A007]|uniref:hypothetical protein n=1 Tax=Raoultella sp. R2A007 TaxID=3416669 RepID=UPI003CF4DC4E
MADSLSKSPSSTLILPAFEHEITYQRALGVIIMLICNSLQRSNWSIGKLYDLLKESVENYWYEIYFDSNRRPVGCICWHRDKLRLRDHVIDLRDMDICDDEMYIYVNVSL